MAQEYLQDVRLRVIQPLKIQERKDGKRTKLRSELDKRNSRHDRGIARKYDLGWRHNKKRMQLRER